MIPLDRVRELLSLAPGPHGGTLMDTSMVHDLARDVLTLADALATAERERDRLTACLARASATIEETERARYAADDERDAARSALDGLTAAVREVEESEGALETMIDDSEWTLDDERIAEERVAAAHTALDALLSAAPAPTTVPATAVRAYLDAVDEWERERSAPVARTVARAAMVAARTALDAALAAATTTPTEGHRP